MPNIAALQRYVLVAVLLLLVHVVIVKLNALPSDYQFQRLLHCAETRRIETDLLVRLHTEGLDADELG